MDLSNLKKLRCERSLLQKDIAKYLGITVAAYSLYETGKRTPSIDVLKKLCKFYNIDMDLLLGWREPEQYHIVYGNPFEDKEQSLTQEELDRRLKEETAKKAHKFVAYDENGNEIKDRPIKFTDASMSFEEALAEAEADELERIQTAYKQLNRKGKEKAAERIEELTEIPRYTNPDKPQGK